MSVGPTDGLVISFDVDGTLCDFENVMTRAMHLTLLELGKAVQVPDWLTVEKAIEIRNQVASTMLGTNASHETIRLTAFQATLEKIGHPDEALASHLTSLYLKHRFENIELYEDAPEVLDVLRKDFRIGILTNGNSYPDRFGLAGMFDFEVYSRDYGIEKPAPRIFEIALEKARCLRHQLVHVGDSVTTDVVGANQAGLTSVWLNRTGQKNPGCTPDYEVSSLVELVDICHKLARESSDFRDKRVFAT